MHSPHDRPARTVLDDLQLADERTLRFNPLGLGGRLTPGDAAEFQAANIADTVLAASVPEEVRANFERARRMYVNGVLDYEMFTAAADFSVQALGGRAPHPLRRVLLERSAGRP